MRIRLALAITLLTGGAFATFGGCAEGENGDTDTPTGTSSTGTTTTGSGTATGIGGGTGTGTGGVGGGTPAGVAANDPCPEVGAQHLLISEISTHGAFGNGGADHGGNYEFIEIWNPTASPIDLSKYYLSDNGVYYEIAQGQFDPDETEGTDFLVKFPAGTQIAANEVLVIQAGTRFDAAWTSADCPDFAIAAASPPTCGTGTVPLMEVPTHGRMGTVPGSMLSNRREMVVLFCWDGAASIVKDVDYVPWGENDDPPVRIDKTAVAGYQPDTAIASQEEALNYYTGGGGGPIGESIGRCDADETGETTSNGNGPAGHDETSESFTQTIEVNSTGSPGVVNSCL